MIIDTSGFADEETEIVAMRVTVGKTAGGTEFLEDIHNSTREQYVGKLQRPPATGTRIVPCAEATNGEGLVTRVCGETTVWDATPPKLFGMWVWHSGYEQYTKPWCSDA